MGKDQYFLEGGQRKGHKWNKKNEKGNWREIFQYQENIKLDE